MFGEESWELPRLSLVGEWELGLGFPLDYHTRPQHSPPNHPSMPSQHQAGLVSQKDTVNNSVCEWGLTSQFLAWVRDQWVIKILYLLYCSSLLFNLAKVIWFSVRITWPLVHLICINSVDKLYISCNFSHWWFNLPLHLKIEIQRSSMVVRLRELLFM